MACIEARGLRKSFGATVALDGVDLQVEEGRILGLIGPNGAGKTTALNAILGLTPISRANCECWGAIHGPSATRLMRDVCFISDVAVLPRWMRVSQALDYVAGVHPRFDRAKAEGFLAKTEIKRTSQVRELSKGMVTQLHLALIMAIDAKLLVLDEPTLGLDILYRKQFYDSLLNDYFDRSRTIVVTTHQVEEVQHVLTDLMFINHGRIVFECNMEDFESRYREVTVNPENLAAARALRPINERQVFGRSILLFDRGRAAAARRARRSPHAGHRGGVRGGDEQPVRADRDAGFQGTRNTPMNTPSNAVPGAALDAQPIAPGLESPTRPLYWSIRRELWEYRSIYIAPLAAAGRISAGILDQLVSFAAQNARPDGARRDAAARADRGEPYTFAALLIMGTTFVVAFFYCLDALQGERRDRSILFWKSLPVSDLTTVLAKASVPLVILPLLTFAITVVTQLDHVAAEHDGAGGERCGRGSAVVTFFADADDGDGRLPPGGDPWAVVRAVLLLAAAGVGVGAADGVSVGGDSGAGAQRAGEGGAEHDAFRRAADTPCGRRSGR